MITIRSAVIDDAEALAALAAETFPLACPPDMRPADLDAYIAAELNPSRFRQLLASPAHDLFLAFEGEVLAGYLMLGRTATPAAVVARHALELCRIYVRASHHGAGVATELMRVAKEQAMLGEYDALWLGAFQRNARALKFYGRHGFAVVGEQQFRVGEDLHDDYILAAALPAKAS